MTVTKKIAGALGAAALAIAATAAPAAAEDREFEWSATFGGTTDYVFRGISFTNERPAIQGSIDMSYGIFYAGAWASNIDGLGYSPWELDLYAGITPSFATIDWDFGIVGYLYPSAETSAAKGGGDFEYVELKAAASKEIVSNLTAGVTFWYTPDQLDNNGGYAETYSIEGTLSYALPQMGVFSPSISGMVGYSSDESGTQSAFGVDDYVYWNAGVSVDVEKFSMDLRYWDTDIDAGFAENSADERVVFTAKVSLP